MRTSIWGVVVVAGTTVALALSAIAAPVAQAASHIVHSGGRRVRADDAGAGERRDGRRRRRRLGGRDGRRRACRAEAGPRSRVAAAGGSGSRGPARRGRDVAPERSGGRPEWEARRAGRDRAGLSVRCRCGASGRALARLRAGGRVRTGGVRALRVGAGRSRLTGGERRAPSMLRWGSQLEPRGSYQLARRCSFDGRRTTTDADRAWRPEGPPRRGRDPVPGG